MPQPLHVAVGDQVTAGQHIADMGSEGQSTGPHLHFEVHRDGGFSHADEPYAWLAERGVPQDSCPA
jgi:murein DD-endopeptidase MepM/ murein hydrolase activator NlpD